VERRAWYDKIIEETMPLFYSKEDLSRKRQLEDKPELAGRLFRQKVAQGLPVDPLISDQSDQLDQDNQKQVQSQMSEDASPRLFGSKASSGKPGFWKSLGTAAISRILPKFSELYSPKVQDEAPSDVKTFDWYSKQSPESQKAYREMKAASTMVGMPFQMEKESKAEKDRNAAIDRQTRASLIAQENKLRDDMNQDPIVKDMKMAQEGYNKIKNFSSRQTQQDLTTMGLLLLLQRSKILLRLQGKAK
jgi:hypothetical protein